MTQAIKGILFDMDDTLIDWHGFEGDWSAIEHTHLKRVYEFLEDAERPLSGSLNHLVTTFRENAIDGWMNARTTLRAPHMVNILEAVLGEFGFVADDEISMRHIIKAYDWSGADDVVLFPDVPTGLQALIDEGIKIGIVTNAYQPMWMRDPELEKFDLLQYFPDENLRISAADVGYLKPHKQIFEYALDKLDLSAENTVYVGDNPVADITGAQGVGMRAVLRINHNQIPEITRLVVPDAAINSFDDLLLLVEDWETHAESLTIGAG